MNHLGLTRSVLQPDHLLQTPETFVRAPLPGMRKATAIVHISRAGRAGFTQYTAELEAGGEIAPAIDQRFVYVLEGEVNAGGHALASGDYAYLPPGHDATLSAGTASRAAVFEKPFQPLDGVTAPAAFSGRESRVAPEFLGDDPWLEVRGLVPDDPAIDFRVNTMTYRPGAALPAVEIHVMEHGLLMLEGGGVYRLSERWYPVQAGDFIWMAPFCPQWFGALGKMPAKYLIYKDWDRHPR
ncbi:MAG: (S)-ureidoglycine aminohydrolase [Vicinamibacterales bacterium]